MSALYVIGGQQRAPRSLLENEQGWYDYGKGLILRVEPESGKVERCLEYLSPPDARGENDPVLFKSGTVEGGRLYACTQTEILAYTLPDFQQVGYLSLPMFNDVHHVRPTADGTLLVANSGLEMVVEVTWAGEVVREWNVLGEALWARFDRNTDYRRGVSTKPHRAHPNHVFTIGDDIWATRFEQRDALCLTQPDRRLHIGTERVHDGLLHDGRLFFTTVDGKIVIADGAARRVDEVIDLAALHPADTLLGWCRAISIEGERAWVGFSRIRPTRFREKVSWIRQGFKTSMPTHIACYDLAARRCLAEIDLEPHGLNAVFTIAPAMDPPTR